MKNDDSYKNSETIEIDFGSNLVINLDLRKIIYEAGIKQEGVKLYSNKLEKVLEKYHKTFNTPFKRKEPFDTEEEAIEFITKCIKEGEPYTE